MKKTLVGVVIGLALALAGKAVAGSSLWDLVTSADVWRYDDPAYNVSCWHTSTSQGGVSCLCMQWESSSYAPNLCARRKQIELDRRQR